MNINHTKLNEYLFSLMMIINILGVSGIAYYYITAKQIYRPVYIKPDIENDLGYKNNTIIRGLAFKDYFCVYTPHSDIKSILEVCTHEYAHTEFGLVDKNNSG